MRKVIVSEFMTLDGVIEGPGNEQDFDRHGWNLPYMDNEAEKYKSDELMAADALLLGSKTYRGFAKFWPTSDLGEFSEQMNSIRKYVVSSLLEPDELVWNNTQHIKDNVTQSIRDVKDQPGKDILVYGSGTLVQTLIADDLIDEYRIMVHPLILGKGARLFRDEFEQKALKLASTRTFPKGIVLLVYTRGA